MKPFDYFEPGDIGTALTLLAEGRGTKILAGGTDLIPQMKKGITTPRAVVNLSKIPELKKMEASPEGIRIGAMVPLFSLAKNPHPTNRYGALVDAICSVAVPGIRNTATIGGNICLDTKCIYSDQILIQGEGLKPCFKRGGEACFLVRGSKFCHSSLCADTVPALIALGASVEVLSLRGKRTISLEALYTGDGIHPLTLANDELVTEILIPRMNPESGSQYLRFSCRRGIDFPLVSAAIYLEKREGICVETRIVLGAVAPGPLRLTGVENGIRGKRLTESLLQESARLASAEAFRISRSGRLDLFIRNMITSLILQGFIKCLDKDLR